MSRAIGVQAAPTEGIHLTDEGVDAAFALYDPDREGGCLSEHPKLASIIGPMFPGREIVTATYSFHRARDSAKGLTISFLVDRTEDGDRVVTDAYRFDPRAYRGGGPAALREAKRITDRRVA